MKEPTDWTPLLRSIRERVQAAAGPFESALLFKYPDGMAGLGWHSDKGHPELIASRSLGAERDFAFGIGPVKRCREVRRLRLAHGSLLLIPRGIRTINSSTACRPRAASESRASTSRCADSHDERIGPPEGS